MANKKTGSRPALDTSFTWLIGVWTVQSTGYAKKEFKGKQQFSWQEPPREFISDETGRFYTRFADTVMTYLTKDGKQTLPSIPQPHLSFDPAASVWVLQGGFDWGSLVAEGWQNNTWVFLGTISLAGLKITERQTWTKISDTELHIPYEELLADGNWFVSEKNIYCKQAFPGVNNGRKP